MKYYKVEPSPLNFFPKMRFQKNAMMSGNVMQSAATHRSDTLSADVTERLRTTNKPRIVSYRLPDFRKQHK